MTTTQTRSVRAAILDAAEVLFAESGYSATSTAQVAAAAGVNRTLIFHYFATKQDLLTTLLHERDLASALDGVTVPPGADGTEQGLLELASEVRARLNPYGAVLRIVLNEMPFQPLARRVYSDFMKRLDHLVHASVADAGPGATPTTARAAASIFAAALLRDLSISDFDGSDSHCAQAACVCARALETEPVGSGTGAGVSRQEDERAAARGLSGAAREDDAEAQPSTVSVARA